MNLFQSVYAGKRVLITGHTGFKGSWLTLWLNNLGAKVSGISLSQETYPNHWDSLNIKVHDNRSDIRDFTSLKNIIDKERPDIVFHLAAQSLVRSSYQDPLKTWSTNVMGTVNLLEACRQQTSIQAVVVVTTDKCYENKEWLWGYRENDILGGHDAYSASKAAAEIATASYRRAFFHTTDSPAVATARAGNVIGGGDWSEDRLIPDLVRCLQQNKSLEIRSPKATRPWQHVLDSLSGYLTLGQQLLSGDQTFAESWNFGPQASSNRSVSEIIDKIHQMWPNFSWHECKNQQPHESSLLFLDSSKAISMLRWQMIWDIDTTLEKTISWYRAWLEDKEVISQQQLNEYISAAQFAKVKWAAE